MMETPMIEVKHLKKYFDTPKGLLHAVDDISFKIGKGKTMGVVGESGCGKSTLGRTIIHLLESTDGQIFLNGEDITRVDRKKMHEINEKMQIVFQDPYSSLNPRQTVEEIIKEPLKLSGRYKKRAELDEKTEELMRLVGIDERLRLAYPHELDGGRRQRVGIARALALSRILLSVTSRFPRWTFPFRRRSSTRWNRFRRSWGFHICSFHTTFPWCVTSPTTWA